VGYVWCRPSGTFPKPEGDGLIDVGEFKETLRSNRSRIGRGLAEGALDFIRKRIAEMSQEV
jgi:hypothetical protein